ncbi:MAG: biotin/lipoyl-binding protein [Calditrichaeota bacterium]|nr:MAG: biotin/lipoyl-binding protein [Calditrichota bacterium]
MAETRYYIPRDEGFVAFTVVENEDGIQIRCGEKTYQVAWEPLNERVALVRLNNRPYRVTYRVQNSQVTLELGGQTIERTVLTAREKLQRELFGKDAETGRGGVVKAPMPGLILRLEVEPGTAVKEGTPLLIMEAMKMENEIRSPVAGTVKDIKVAPNQAVEKDDLLLVIE